MRDGRRDHRRNPKRLAEASRRSHRTVPLSLPATNAEPEIECPTTSHTSPPLITPQTSAHAPNVTDSRTRHAPSRLPQTTRSVQCDRGAFGQRVCTSPRSSRPSAQIRRLTPGSAGSAAPSRDGDRRLAPPMLRTASTACKGSPEASHKARLVVMASVVVRAEVASARPPPVPHRRPVTVSDHDRRRGWWGDGLSQIPTTHYGLVNTGVVTLWNTL
jgi:hypothetical protein